MNLKNFLRFLIMQNLILLTILQDVQAFSLHENNELIKTTPFNTSGEYIPQNLQNFLNKIETFISPLAFSLLLLLMLAYWSQAAFFGKEKYKTLNNFLFFFALTSLTLLLSVRWIISKHFPLSNLYESLVFLALCFLSLKAIFLPRRKLTQKAKVLTKQNLVSPSTEVMELNQIFVEAKLPTIAKRKQNNANTLKPVLQNEIFNGAGEPVRKRPLYEISPNQNQHFNDPNLLNQGAKFFKGNLELNISNRDPNVLGFSNHLTIEKKADFLDLALGVILSPLSLLTFGFAFLSLPKEMQQSTALVPALQSNWLMMHVTVMILSYAALISGSILSIAFLILSYFESSYRSDEPLFLDENKVFTSPKVMQSFVSTEKLPPVKKNKGFTKYTFQSLSLVLSEIFVEAKLLTFAKRKQTNAKQNVAIGVKRLTTEVDFSSLTVRLDNYSYRILALGFPLLTIGILSGAVWANEAWGSYWSWDPKETWALITWLVFAIYLHTRITKGWSGQKPAIVASVGFFMVWFCYLGVNLLGTGLHSYGWFTKTFTG